MSRNILALIDFSEIAPRIIRMAGELAKYHEAKCWLVHVAAPDPDFVGYDVGPQYIRDHRADQLKEEHEQLMEYKEQLNKEGVDTEALLVQGPLMQTIDGEIEKLHIDLVVLGSHGHSRLHDMLVGSVCEHLLRHAKVPLMVIPARD